MPGYFTRTELLIGKENMEKIAKASVMVIGLGGVGSYAAEAVARAGVGNIILVDHDKVVESNINRQLPALTSTLGRLKVEVMGERIKDINPDVNLRIISLPYNEDTSSEILKGTLDYVIDAIDSLPDKLHLIKTCLGNKIPIVSSMGTANRLNPQFLKIGDISQTRICPMARKIRRELRKEGIFKGLPVVYSEEEPVKNDYNGETRLGSISYVPSVAGLLLASFVINSLISK
ncbi:tRNA A37 threonylcarbamoyladenosine dehydratase [Thermosyntropha lipolytica DSM 11003]|uniref:tRNA A37 threonylcarbamoyladenosine dehydratase n=1 Tax=Thermosyntropha lipolytica DSM 11003 TaxID=1123382 RepID=A0A1M5NZK3_9FIRM|nr:tRNA threonylcarbamoyladenosine dehydratase [Thermosyntropha lipolytica]SHG95004.1 tRNA A37 threonylcarbamoyladenosine dehydratase [Thermosyntropha lipolytica DSM 11003]